MTDAENRPSLFKRLLLGAAIVILASASATAFAAFRELDRVGDHVRSGPALLFGDELAEADTGDPQTIMVIGSDKRASTSRDVQRGVTGGARSDTVILIRLDPSRKATALLSLPRDLKVKIPGHGTDRLNAAFSIGGPRLTLRTVKELTGLRINHVINVDFGGFREAVDAIGCVFVDIDRRYFNDNTGPGEDYATIDVQPGYQRLCGRKALDYVRYRHEDNDLVRAARQQEFLRQAKQQVGLGQLIEDRERLLQIFGDYTESDIRSNRAIARLLNLAIAAAQYPIREVHFRGEITSGSAATNTPSYVVARRAVVQRITREFLGVTGTKGPRGQAAPRRRRRGARPGSALVAANGKDQALAALAEGARIPMYYPTRLTRGASFAPEPRVYAIRAPDGRIHHSYRFVVKRGLIGEYYGLQGTSWKDPPILRSPSEKRRIGDREYELHYDGDRLRLVAWRTEHAAYWISNTLLQSLSERQMLEIARSARLLG
jgi:polyisoprenyl-teichoic acid--peptidoglycan teichoic acid transferase